MIRDRDFNFVAMVDSATRSSRGVVRTARGKECGNSNGRTHFKQTKFFVHQFSSVTQRT